MNSLMPTITKYTPKSTKVRAALLAAPTLAALVAASPASALLPAGNSIPAPVTSLQTVSAVVHSPVSGLTLAEIQAAYQDVINANAALVDNLNARVAKLNSSVGGAATASKSEHVEAKALSVYASKLSAALAKIPSTGVFTSTGGQQDTIAALLGRIKALQANANKVAALPVEAAIDTTTVNAVTAALTKKTVINGIDLAALDPALVKAILAALVDDDGWCDHKRNRGNSNVARVLSDNKVSPASFKVAAFRVSSAQGDLRSDNDRGNHKSHRGHNGHHRGHR